MDDSFDQEKLRSFVSSPIFDFLSSNDMNPESIDDPSPSSPATLTSPTPLNHAAAATSPTSPDALVDALLLACSQQYEGSPLEQETKRSKLDPSKKVSTKKRAFAVPKTEEEVAQAKLSAVPAKTLADTSYCFRIWKEWCDHRLVSCGNSIPSIEQLTPSELASYMSNFVFEVRKKSGEVFPPKSLHHIVCGIQRHLRMTGNSTIDIFKDSEFAEFRVCLDSEMKRLQTAGHGSKTRKAEPLTVEEEVLWTKGLLGKGSPQVLLDTILVLNGIYFALRSGSEHRQLRADPCQITLHERPSHRPYLEYV